MSELCLIRIILDAKYIRKNIHTILFQGHNNGFKYYDYTWDKDFNEIKTIDSQQATQQIISLFNKENNDGAYVFTKLGLEEDFTLWFYKEEENNIKFCIGDFGAGCKKKEYRLDVGHYTSLFLSLCNDFSILEVNVKFLD